MWSIRDAGKTQSQKIGSRLEGLMLGLYFSNLYHPFPQIVAPEQL